MYSHRIWYGWSGQKFALGAPPGAAPVAGDGSSGADGAAPVAGGAPAARRGGQPLDTIGSAAPGKHDVPGDRRLDSFVDTVSRTSPRFRAVLNPAGASVRKTRLNQALLECRNVSTHNSPGPPAGCLTP